MYIAWHENPLKSSIKLTESERKNLLLLSFMEDATDTFSLVQYYLTENKKDSREKALRYANELKLYDDNDNKVWKNDEYLKSEYGHLITEIEESFSHKGDCTCFPFSCLKCYAESILGVNTIEGLDKHMAHSLYSAYEKYGDNINEVLSFLQKPYIPPPYEGVWKNLYKQTEFDVLIQSWDETHKKTHEWLSNYKNLHFKNL